MIDSKQHAHKKAGNGIDIGSEHPVPENRSADLLSKQIGHQARRMKKHRDHPGDSPLRGLSTFGMIGWSVAIPTVVGAFAGMWLDSRIQGNGNSWTIALILGGLATGVLIAWLWIDREGTS